MRCLNRPGLPLLALLLPALTRCVGAAESPYDDLLPLSGITAVERADGGGTALPTDGGGGGGEVPAASCDVAALLRTSCTACHGRPVSQAAPYPIETLEDLRKPSPTYPGQTVAQRSLVRMRQAIAPMPPATFAPARTAELAAFAQWVEAGTPDGACTAGFASDAGTPVDAGLPGVDAGTAALTCASGSYWTQGNSGSGSMNPGMACQACHLGQNFMGQNPNGESKTSKAFFFMGSLYPSLHEKDRCNDNRVPSGTVVEILDSAGVVRLTLTPNSVGNFYSSTTTAGFPLPYRARVVSNGKVNAMVTPQQVGDCNTCHTERGTGGAPGRVTYLP